MFCLIYKTCRGASLRSFGFKLFLPVVGKCCFVASYGFFESEVEGVAYKRMAYRYFTQEGDAAAEKSEIVEVQVVAGIDSQSEASCHSCRFGKGGYSCFGVAVVGVGVWLGVQLYAVGSGGGRRAYYVGIGVDEDRASYAGFLETFDER